MSAARLRAAATLLRERAEAANGAPWDVERSQAGQSGLMEVFLVQSKPLAEEDRDPEIAQCIDRTDVDFIATMNLTVALAVADWLEASAAFEQHLNRGGSERDEQRWKPHQWNQALAVADAILAGGAS